MNYSKYAIVVVGYNRPDNVLRLLSSLEKANYENEQVDLIISIDNSGSNKVECVANEFAWKYGNKRIVTYPERMGLRKHILHCGDFVENYDAIAVLEDDLYVSEAFFQYMKAAVKKYSNDDRIAGISLYTHLWNPNPSVNLPFCPDESGYDNFFIQYAQSWGQIWMKKQWSAFMEWYKYNSDEIVLDECTPSYIATWNNSWLKYHIKYCIEKNKYFVYPYRSYTTCFTDVGEHNDFGGAIYQVQLAKTINREFCFCDIDSVDAVCYDAYFERDVKAFKLVNSDELIVDIYGAKPIFRSDKRYILTTRKLNYQIIKTFELCMRPHEENIINDIKGNCIYLYDTSITVKQKKINEEVKKYIYYHRLHGNMILIFKTGLAKIREYLTIKKIQLVKKR